MSAHGGSWDVGLPLCKLNPISNHLIFYWLKKLLREKVNVKFKLDLWGINKQVITLSTLMLQVSSTRFRVDLFTPPDVQKNKE